MRDINILVTHPDIADDPTSWTSKWADDAIRMIVNHPNRQNIRYTVIGLKGTECTYQIVSEYLYKYSPVLYVDYGHGCVSNLMGQSECMITNGHYNMGSDNCYKACQNQSNVELLDGTITYTVACYTASDLGYSAVNNGCINYTGYKDMLLFPVDNAGVDKIFSQSHIVFLGNLINGSSVAEAERSQRQYEDAVITKYKYVKYVSLPMLWNRLNRRIIGNVGARLWS